MRKRGFTLIELLIVLAILGILVGIVAMSVGDLNETALKRGLQSEWSVVQTAIDAYNTQDVTVGTESAITDSGTDYAAITSATSGFNKYLKRNTKYFYLWDADGEGLIVRDKAGATDYSFDYNGTTFGEPS